MFEKNKQLTDVDVQLTLMRIAECNSISLLAYQSPHHEKHEETVKRLSI